MSKVDDAQACFSQGYSCSQAVAATFAEDFGVDRETMLRISGPFGGGVARTGGICGAAGGALMILGLKYASTQPDPVAKDRMYQIAREFVEVFRARNGAVDCRDLLGYDIGTPEGRQSIKESGVSKTVCPRAVASAVELLDEMLQP
jgi:C_GCAxxG_C_C family probable redox protein